LVTFRRTPLSIEKTKFCSKNFVENQTINVVIYHTTVIPVAIFDFILKIFQVTNGALATMHNVQLKGLEP
jgi:hypothetical protein